MITAIMMRTKGLQKKFITKILTAMDKAILQSQKEFARRQTDTLKNPVIATIHAPASIPMPMNSAIPSMIIVTGRPTRE